MRSGFLLALLPHTASAATLVTAGPDVVPGEYLVVLRRDIPAAAHRVVATELRGRALRIGDGAKAFRAVHAALDAAALRRAVAHPNATYVEPNQRAHAVRGVISCPQAQGEPLSWGQKRTTAAAPGDVLSSFAHNAAWGSGVDAYVLDTGIRITHEEFEGRAIWGANFAGGADTDNNGHGTHCAGTIGGKTYGVAKATTLVAVKVLGDSGSGSYDGIISGIEWTVAEAAARGRRGVGSMSLGGGYSAALNDAVNAAAAAGVLFVNAAGNDNADSCSYSPASAEGGLTVGSTELASQGGEQVDVRSSFSNYGPCNDVYAPGTAIVSAYYESDSSYATLSGTSMATPHAAGVAAVMLQQYGDADAAGLKGLIAHEAVAGLVLDPGAGTPNLMLHVDCDHAPPVTPVPTPAPPTPAPPVTPAPETNPCGCSAECVDLCGQQPGGLLCCAEIFPYCYCNPPPVPPCCVKSNATLARRL